MITTAIYFKNIFKTIVKVFIVCSVTCFPNRAFSQKINAKWYKSQRVTNEFGKVQIQDAVSKAGYLKFKLTIQNTGNKTLFFSPSHFKIQSGDSFYTYTGNSKSINPGDRYSEVITFKKKNLMKDSFYIENLAISTDSEVLHPIFIKDMLIPKMNSLLDSSIILKVKTLKRLNKMTFIQFEIVNISAGSIKCNPGKSRLKLPSGAFLNPEKVNPDELLIIQNSTSSKFSLFFTCAKTVADLKKDPVTILWEDTFLRVKTAQVFSEPIKIVIDPVLTRLENK